MVRWRTSWRGDDSWSGREGARASFIYVRGEGGIVEFRSTWVDPRVRGRGVGAGLVGAALEWAKGDGIKVIITCRFVITVVGRHPEYRPLLER